MLYMLRDADGLRAGAGYHLPDPSARVYVVIRDPSLTPHTGLLAIVRGRILGPRSVVGERVAEILPDGSVKSAPLSVVSVSSTLHAATYDPCDIVEWTADTHDSFAGMPWPRTPRPTGGYVVLRGSNPQHGCEIVPASTLEASPFGTAELTCPGASTPVSLLYPPVWLPDTRIPTTLLSAVSESLAGTAHAIQCMAREPLVDVLITRAWDTLSVVANSRYPSSGFRDPPHVDDNSFRSSASVSLTLLAAAANMVTADNASGFADLPPAGVSAYLYRPGYNTIHVLHLRPKAPEATWSVQDRGLPVSEIYARHGFLEIPQTPQARWWVELFCVAPNDPLLIRPTMRLSFASYLHMILFGSAVAALLDRNPEILSAAALRVFDQPVTCWESAPRQALRLARSAPVSAERQRRVVLFDRKTDKES